MKVKGNAFKYGDNVDVYKRQGLTMAEYFRDKEHQNVLLFIDNIFRFTQAGSEAVSYTHLDVYKRQIQRHCNI